MFSSVTPPEVDRKLAVAIQDLEYTRRAFGHLRLDSAEIRTRPALSGWRRGENVLSNQNICMWFHMYTHVPPPAFPARLSRIGARWLPSEEWRATSLLRLSPKIRWKLIMLHHDPLTQHTHILPEKPFRFDSSGLDTESVCCIICLQERCRPPLLILLLPTLPLSLLSTLYAYLRSAVFWY